MKVVNVGYNYRHQSDFYVNRLYGSGDYILLILKTKAYFVLKNKRITVNPDSVIIFDKGTPQVYGAISDEYINDWIHFEITYEEKKKIKELGIPFDTVLSFKDTNVFSGFIKNIFLERYSQNLYKDDSMNLYFNLLLRKLSENLKLPDLYKENHYYDEFCTLRNEIRLSPQKIWKRDDICKKMNLSRSYVQHMYKTFFDSSISADITQSRMEYAKYLLSTTDMTVSNIAYMCGYENDVHFMRLFKKTAGTTPSKYRKKIKIVRDELLKSKNQNPFCL